MISCTRELPLKVIIATPFKYNESNIDPANVQSVQDATIARAMYGGLLEYNKDGKLVLGLASKYEVEGNKVTFDVGKKSKLSNGEYLSARDVEYTFKRNILRGSTTHSNFRGFVCGEENIKHIEQSCSGIVVDEKLNKITFILTSEQLVDSFISIVTSHDFRIIPRASLDENLNIVNRKIVSGPYFLEKINKDNNIMELRANEYHYKVSEKNSKTVILKHVSESELEARFENGEIDVIPMFHFMNLSTFKKLSVDNNNFKTEGIKNFFIRFTNKGFSKLNSRERLIMGNQFKEKYLNINPTSDLFIHGETIFPELSEAYLDKKFLSEYGIAIKKDDIKLNKNKKLIIGLTKLTYEKVKKEMGENQSFDIVLLEKPISQIEERDLPDAYLETIDSTFTGTASALVYALRVGVYGFDKTESEAMIRELYAIKDYDMKLELIKNIHKKILIEGRAISFGHAPYVAISNKRWRINFSKFYAATSLLDITHDE